MTDEEAKLTIDYLKEMQKDYIEGEGYERHPLPEWYALDKAIETIGQTIWIPVSERLPENDDDVLVQMNDGSMMVDFRAASSSSWFWAEKDDLPVAWMPLPPSYQGE